MSILFVISNYISSKLDNRDIINVSSITRIYSPSFSTLYFEPRLFSTEIKLNDYYPEMELIDRMEFVYEQK